ncbi:MAG: GNAT family N-acetyltransferase [SAR86 cluster bacterium]|uniref:GNAT family N-acetyltransferase n=1 Tax=SAR86 cluster bacterium TaxID=2030880 RepID=A0A2A4XB30_9GAMM|nr:MAG: GNAT family N-acetyltransferase [SAR86 cluster bacterium]
MTHIIRHYVEGDLEGVLSSWESASKIAHPFLKEEFLETERYNIPNVYMPNADTWVAEVKGNVVGFIALIGNEVGAIFLDPKFQGIGIGKALMDKAQELHGTLEVEVFKANSIGRKFYGRYGFEFLAESTHEPTNQGVLRLKFVPC